MPDNDVLSRLPPVDDRAWTLSILKAENRLLFAKSILNEALEHLAPAFQGDSRLSVKLANDPNDGEACIEYSGRYIGGGHFRLVFKPINAVEEIVTSCIKVFYKQKGNVLKTMRLRPTIRPQELEAEQQVNIIREMAYSATVTLVAGYSRRQGFAQLDGHEDSRFVAEAVLAWRLSGGRFPPKQPVADVRDEVEKLGERVARRRKLELNGTIRLLPGMLVTREKRGREPGFKIAHSEHERRRQKREGQVLDALRGLRNQEKRGAKEVADHLELSRRTISNWAKKYDWDWEDLKTRALLRGKL
jgi:hypothetical protein